MNSFRNGSHWEIVDNPAEFVKMYIMVIAINLCVLFQMWNIGKKKHGE